MTILNFDSLKVTTMTVITKIKGTVVIDMAFPLINITRLELKKRLRQTKKFKIPYCGVPGAILSAKFKGMTKGIIKTASNSFLNSITLDVCTSKKNVNAKLSGNIIQMCGANSENLAIETAQHIIDHILDIQDDLDYVNENKETRDNVIEWIQNNTKGDEYIIDSDTHEIIILDEGDTINEDKYLLSADGSFKLKEIEVIFNGWHDGDTVTPEKIILNKNREPYIISLPKGKKEVAVIDYNFFIVSDEKQTGKYYFLDNKDNEIYFFMKSRIKTLTVNSLVIPEQYPDNYPENLDEDIVNFYIKYAPDFAYHNVYCQFLESIKQIETVCSDDLAVESVKMAMINYSYSLGMSIDRKSLYNYINGLNGFTARYYNSADHAVTISLPYETDATVSRKKKTLHTFMVHKSGIVTQSGPNIKLMRGAYYRFMSTIMQIRSKIIRPERAFNLKYTPVYPKELIAKPTTVVC